MALTGLADKRIEFFDYLRALAIFLVIVAHHRLSELPGGSIGVSLFFCLSGFLITALLLDEETLTGPTAWRFIIRRFMRVYPAYLATLIFLLFMMAVKGNPLLPGYLQALPGLLFFASLPSTWLGMGTGVLWTLHVEFWFYVSMPLLMMLVGRGKGLLAAAVVLICASYVLKVFAADSAVTLPGFSPLQLLIWIDTLLYGAIVAIVARSDTLHLQRWIAWPLVLCGVVGIVAIALWVPNTRVPTWFIESTVASILTAAILCAYSSAPFTFHVAPLAWFGRISYSIYLLHAISLDYHIEVWPLKGKELRAFLVVSILVLALHYGVEKPGIRLGRRLTSRKDRLDPQREQEMTRI